MPGPGLPPLITVFGGSGFIGRYVCEALLKAGARIRVAERDPRKAWFLQPLGGVGMVATTMANLSKPATIAPAIEGASAVVNLVGVFAGDLDSIHVDGPRHIAAAAKAQGAALVHVSAIGADPAAPSAYGRTKGQGEATVRAACPSATIIRPSIVFGPEDQFTNRFAALAGLPIMPVMAPKARFQPVFVRDLARAIAAAALDPKAHGGKTYELGGPDVMTMRGLTADIARLAHRHPLMIELPDAVASGISMFGFLPGAPITRDQWLMLGQDNVASGEGFKAFGIAPTPLDAVAHEWLGRFKSGGRFAPSKANA